MIYLWLKALHIVAVIAWMAGLFYLPRLFVYHVSREVGSEADLLFRLMERRLLFAIMRPAGLLALLSGLTLSIVGKIDFSTVWLLVKLVGVFGLVIFHLSLERYRLLLAAGWRGRGERFFRVLNELPTILLIWIVVWVVVKPYS